MRFEKAQDGDTIEFENGYVFQWPTDEVIVINKSLHFCGACSSKSKW